jgi:hypothetical protein
MSKVYTDTVTAGATLKTNTVKDSGGNTLWTSDGSGNLSSVNTALKGNMTLLSTQTASNAASVSFTSGIDSTYKLYIFKYYNVNPATDGAEFGFQANASSQSGYNETMTSTYFRARLNESGADGELGYFGDEDQAEGTGFQTLAHNQGNGADEACAGELHLFNPSSTTYVKHFYARAVANNASNESSDIYAAGYINVTAAITNIQFKMDSGNMDAVIKMYGMG